MTASGIQILMGSMSTEILKLVLACLDYFNL